LYSIFKALISVLAPYRTLPMYGFQGGLWTIVNHLVKIIVPPVTAYMELEAVSPLFF